MSEEIKVYINSNEDGFITDCYFADNTKVSCEFYHEESEIEYSNCKLLNLQDYIKEKDQQIVYLQSQLDQANERLKDVSVSKFELGQEVFVFDWDEQIRSGRIYEIQINAVLHDRQPHITYLVDFTSNYSDDDQENDYYEEKDIYATEEEINKKLQELRGGE